MDHLRKVVVAERAEDGPQFRKYLGLATGRANSNKLDKISGY